jgi:DNA-binding transcriptional LysR family regulator
MFVRTVDEGSVSAAARSVHLTQPALSRNLKLLEEDVGTRLFARSGRRLVLTPAGRALLPEARSLLEAAQRVETQARRAAADGYYDLRLGCIDSVATYLLPGALRDLRRTWPRLKVTLVTGRSSELIDAIAEGRLDVALVASSGAPPRLASVRVAPYRLEYYGRADVFPELVRCRTTKDLDGLPRVEIAPHTATASERPRALSHAVASNVASVKALVLEGFGVGDLPSFMLTRSEARRLVKAKVPHDASCALYLVVSESWRATSGSALTAALARRVRERC